MRVLKKYIYKTKPASGKIEAETNEMSLITVEKCQKFFSI